MRVLVTGGAGYIGSVTTGHLLDAGHDVVVLDDLRSGSAAAVPDGARLVQGDVADVAMVDRLLSEGFDACLHFAALIEAGESMQRPEAFFRNNTAGALLLLDRLLAHGIERFVLSSTAAVYGTPDSVPITEAAATRPTNAYGASKLFVEQALRWLADLRGLRYAALRYFNAAGAWRGHGEAHDPESHLIPLVLRVPLGQRDSIDIYGTDYPTRDGTCVRDYIHVADLANAHVRALEVLDEHRRVICNLGNGAGFSVREVIESARRVTGHPIPVRETPRRPGDPAELIASADRARDLLGWSPDVVEIDEIIASAWDWHRGQG